MGGGTRLRWTWRVGECQSLLCLGVTATSPSKRQAPGRSGRMQSRQTCLEKLQFRAAEVRKLGKVVVAGDRTLIWGLPPGRRHGGSRCWQGIVPVGPSADQKPGGRAPYWQSDGEPLVLVGRRAGRRLPQCTWRSPPDGGGRGAWFATSSSTGAGPSWTAGDRAPSGTGERHGLALGVALVVVAGLGRAGVTLGTGRRTAARWSGTALVAAVASPPSVR